MKKCLGLLLLAILTVKTYASEVVTLSGQVVDDEGTPLANVAVSVGNFKTKTNHQGQYTLKARQNAVYQLSVKRSGYYDIVHTFSHYELYDLHAGKPIPDISLVKKEKGRVMLAFAGDVMMGRRYYKPYFDDPVLITDKDSLEQSKAIVSHIKPYMALADYAAVNLETQIAEEKPKERAPKSVTFFSRPNILKALSWAGIDYVSLGNNHTYDFLDSGLESTLAHLNDSELDYSGAGETSQQALAAHRETINGQAFSMLGYVGWEGSARPSQVATHEHGGAAFGTEDNIASTVEREQKAKHIPIVQYHGSQEYANNPTGVTEQRLKLAIDKGAAVSIGHHPHVTQGLELYNNQLIAYSMGNFIFDQNFSATQNSFVLYVWLDEGKFHRAEIVPVYVKGYKPLPATGMQRFTVMKRLASLSAARATYIGVSGGHGVITPENKSVYNNSGVTVKTNGNQTYRDMYDLAWHQPVNKVVLSDNNLKYRLGSNLVNGSDFESYTLFNTNERGFVFDKAQVQLANEGASGRHSLSLNVNKAQPHLFGMKHFRRVYEKSSPMTVTAQIKTEKPIKVNVYWQGRKTRQKLFDAFNNGKMNLIKSIELAGKTEWQLLGIDFNSPRIGYKSYRVLLEFISEDNKNSTVLIDDFSLIEWHTAFTKSGTHYHHNTLNQQATHVGISQAKSTNLSMQ